MRASLIFQDSSWFLDCNTNFDAWRQRCRKDCMTMPRRTGAFFCHLFSVWYRPPKSNVVRAKLARELWCPHNARTYLLVKTARKGTCTKKQLPRESCFFVVLTRKISPRYIAQRYRFVTQPAASCQASGDALVLHQGLIFFVICLNSS